MCRPSMGVTSPAGRESTRHPTCRSKVRLGVASHSTGTAARWRGGIAEGPDRVERRADCWQPWSLYVQAGARFGLSVVGVLAPVINRHDIREHDDDTDRVAAHDDIHRLAMLARDVVDRVPERPLAGSPRHSDTKELRSTPGGGGVARAEPLDKLNVEMQVMVGRLTLVVGGVSDAHRQRLHDLDRQPRAG